MTKTFYRNQKLLSAKKKSSPKKSLQKILTFFLFKYNNIVVCVNTENLWQTYSSVSFMNHDHKRLTQINDKRNINRGTTDPGYWVYNLNHVFDWNKFEIILAEKDHSSYGLNTLGPLCLWQCFFSTSVNFFSTFSSISIFTCTSSNFGHQRALYALAVD